MHLSSKYKLPICKGAPEATIESAIMLQFLIEIFNNYLKAKFHDYIFWFHYGYFWPKVFFFSYQFLDLIDIFALIKKITISFIRMVFCIFFFCIYYFITYSQIPLTSHAEINMNIVHKTRLNVCLNLKLIYIGFCLNTSASN